MLLLPLNIIVLLFEVIMTVEISYYVGLIEYSFIDIALIKMHQLEMRAFKRKTSFKRLELLKRLNGLQTKRNETEIFKTRPSNSAHSPHRADC